MKMTLFPSKTRNVVVIATLLTQACVLQLFANAILVDRGLPTDNLNNAAGGNRSNVSWSDWEQSSSLSEYWLPGDSFAISGSGNYLVDTIRVWTTGDNTGLTLWGGKQGSTISQVSSSFVATPVTYGNGQGYQGSSGSFYQLYQVDFTVNIPLAAGQTYDFFLDGPWSAYASGGYVNPFLHASNAALSGSQQDGSDDTFLWLDVKGASSTVQTWFSGTGGGTTGFSAGWDKNSDANVQVLGSSVPDAGSTLLLLGSSLAGLSFVQRKLKPVK